MKLRNHARHCLALPFQPCVQLGLGLFELSTVYSDPFSLMTSNHGTHDSHPAAAPGLATWTPASSTQRAVDFSICSPLTSKLWRCHCT